MASKKLVTIELDTADAVKIVKTALDLAEATMKNRKNGDFMFVAERQLDAAWETLYILRAALTPAKEKQLTARYGRLTSTYGKLSHKY